MRFSVSAALVVGITSLLTGMVPVAASLPTEQRLSWGSCPGEVGDAQCAKVAVPLDYSAPGGRTIQVMISRVKAKGSQRRGILLANPGGPGGVGLGYARGLRAALGDVADQYDLIGFDPRFLGESGAVGCGGALVPGDIGTKTSPREDFEAVVESAKDIARRCFEHDGGVLAHASTRNVARDMDAIRAALGEAKLSYYGVSYGADLGAVFTMMFPHRADRIVIDSSTDPVATQYELFQRTGGPLERALDEWAGWAAKHHREYGLGRTGGEVRGTVLRLVKRAERKPILVAGDKVGAAVVRLMLKQPLQHAEHDPVLAAVVRDLVAAEAGRLIEPGPELAGMVSMLKSPELQAGFVGGALFMCGDGGWPAGGWPKNPEAYWANMQRSRAAQPVFGPYVNGMIAPCAFWRVTPREPGTRVGNNVPLLMLHARRDNNVTYESGVALHRKLTGSRLVTADIRSHGVYGRTVDGLTPVPCADNAVNDYLRNGTMPATDITC